MRMRFNFWLNLDKPEEYEIAETIDELKGKRGFSQTIRDGIRLINDLRQGNIDVLRELFPWVFDAVYAAAEADIIAQQKIAESEPQRDLVLEQLARLEAQMEKLGAMPIDHGKPSRTPIPKPFALEDEPEIEVTKAKPNSEVNTAFNYAISLSALSGSFDSLPQEIIEYGVRIGKIPKSVLEKRQKQTALPPTTTITGNIKALDVPQFAQPAFDDDDDVGIDLFT